MSMEEDINKLRSISQSMMRLFAVEKPNKIKLRLDEFIESLLKKYREILAGRVEVKWDVEDGVELNADPDLLREALLNLIQNSIEAMPEGGKLFVNVYSIREVKGDRIKEIIIEIEDTGIGMTKEQLKKVFMPHYSTKQKGMGIGLTITKRIVEVHGGSIEILSKTGVGTKVTLRFPSGESLQLERKGTIS